MERRMHSVPDALGEQFVRTTGLARVSNHGVHLINECLHFPFHFKLTQGERDHRGVV